MIYLLGSMHFGNSDFFPLPESIEIAYNESEVLAVEVDMSKITADMATNAILRYGRLPTDQVLSQRLSAKVYADLVKQAERAKLPLEALQRFQPWFVAVQLIEAEIRKTDLRQNLGIDLYFINKSSKPVESLESLEQQLSLFGNLTIGEQEKFLSQTLNDLHHSGAYLNSMASAWQRGDTQLLVDTLITPFKENKDTKKLFQKIFTERNDRMAAAVQQYLAQKKNVFFVVGVGHMLGEQGIVAQLIQQGVDVERVEFESAN